MSSLLYENIKHVCKKNGIKIRDIEAPYKAGYISRYERRGIMNLPLHIVNKVAILCNVTVDDLLNKDLARQTKLEDIRNEMARLKEIEQELSEVEQ